MSEMKQEKITGEPTEVDDATAAAVAELGDLVAATRVSPDPDEGQQGDQG